LPDKESLNVSILKKEKKIAISNFKVTYICATLKLHNNMNTIKHTFFFPHPAEKVWEYLTKPELLSQWLMPNDIKPVVGHKFQFTSAPKPQLNHDGQNYCEVLEIIPFKKLTYSWKAGPERGIINLDTIVFWTLTPKDNGTELHLEHGGFKEGVNDAIYEGMNAGWVTHTNKISPLINQIPNNFLKQNEKHNQTHIILSSPCRSGMGLPNKTRTA